MIKDKYLKEIKENPICTAELQVALGKSFTTIYRYLRDNDIMLTTTAALAVIKKYTGAKESQILEQQKAA